MSGHSKWSNIKRKKEKTDSQKAKVFTKIGREIAVCVKEGGGDPNNNSRLRDLIAKAKAIVPVLIPLLISAFRRGDELGDAMDARCYTGSKVRTKYKKLTFTKKELVSSLVTIVFWVGVFLLNIYGAQIVAFISGMWS